MAAAARPHPLHVLATIALVLGLGLFHGAKLIFRVGTALAGAR